MWIRKANLSDITSIEWIFDDVVKWFDATHKNHWRKEEVTWQGLRRFHHHEEFYLAYINGMPAGCMALSDYDPAFWPNMKKGQALYIHKLSVRRAYAKKGVSQALITFAKMQALQKGVASLRLDCGQDRLKLRQLYEHAGFILVDERTMFGSYNTAFYMYPVALHDFT